MKPKKLSKESSNGHKREDEWSEVTRGERYVIRTTSEEAGGHPAHSATPKLRTKADVATFFHGQSTRN